MRAPADNLDPAQQFALQTIAARRKQRDGRVAWWRLEAGAGAGKDTVRHWAMRGTIYGAPIGIVRGVLNELGYDLAVVPLAHGEGD